jgi:tetratricopeptide (TPR) repeat protein
VWYLKGRYCLSHLTEAGLKQAIVFFTKAIEEDPANALAYAGLAYAYASFATWSVQAPAEAFRQSRQAALRALQLDENLAQAHSALGTIALYHDWNFAEAEREYRHALELGPNDPIVHQTMARYFEMSANFPEALREARRARDLDPLSLDVDSTVGWILLYSRKYEESIAEFRKLVDLDPHYSVAHYCIGAAYYALGDFEKAIPELETSSRLVNDREPSALGLYAAAKAQMGNRAEAEGILNAMLQRSGKEFVSPVGPALIYLGLGNKDSALQWLDKMFQEHLPAALFAGVNPLYDPVRSSPEFLAQLSRINGRKLALSSFLRF